MQGDFATQVPEERAKLSAATGCCCSIVAGLLCWGIIAALVAALIRGCS